MMHRLFSVLLAFAATIATPALAQDAEQAERLEQRAEDIVAAMRDEAQYDAVFADDFVNAVPEAQFRMIQQQIEGQFGSMVGVDSVEPANPFGANIAIRFERGMASGQFVLEPGEPYEVTGFRLSELRPMGDSFEQWLSDVEALPGQAGVLVTRVGEAEPLAAYNASQHFAIGSTFKLYVLSALARSIAAGERDWDDTVPLSMRSYPSGMMQTWPDGAPVTLHTLATLMISISDNTATDQLIAILGRDAVEAEVVASDHGEPQATFPFLTTRELFLLKSGSEVDADEYLTSDVDWRRAALERLATIERDADQVEAAFTGGPNAIEVEWLASPTDIARLFQRIVATEDETALDILAVNPSLTPAMRGEWAYAGYKGGSEPGVLNLSWLLRDEVGDWFAVTMSWNNAETVVDESTFELLAMRAVSLAASR